MADARETLYGHSPCGVSVRTKTADFVAYTSALVPIVRVNIAETACFRGRVRGSIPLGSTIKRLVRRGSGKADGQKPKMYGHADRIGRRVLGSGNVPKLLVCFLKVAYTWRMTTSESATPARIEAAAKAILNDNPFNDEHGLWDVPSIRSHYISIATVALAAADAVDPRKPRTITTVEELDALPEGSVILTNAGADSAQKDGEGEWYLWGGDYGLDSEDIFLPATVLHEPEAEAAA